MMSCLMFRIGLFISVSDYCRGLILRGLTSAGIIHFKKHKIQKNRDIQLSVYKSLIIRKSSFFKAALSDYRVIFIL